MKTIICQISVKTSTGENVLSFFLSQHYANWRWAHGVHNQISYRFRVVHNNSNAITKKHTSTPIHHPSTHMLHKILVILFSPNTLIWMNNQHTAHPPPRQPPFNCVCCVWVKVRCGVSCGHRCHWVVTCRRCAILKTATCCSTVATWTICQVNIGSKRGIANHERERAQCWSVRVCECVRVEYCWRPEDAYVLLISCMCGLN